MALALHNLKPNPRSRHRPKRIGRGNASGHGTYATRGQKGQRARSGGRRGLKRLGLRRLVLSIPKRRGFQSSRQAVRVINLDLIEKRFESDAEITTQTLIEAGLIRPNEEVKILGRGDLTKKVLIKNLPVSEPARIKIVAAGGRVE